jgi:hypothetical protein
MNPRSAALVTTLAALLLAAPPALANRRASLHGNLLMEDPQDIYLFPQRALDYRNLVRFDMGHEEPDGFPGDGLLLFGSDTFAMGIAAHRSDQLDPFGSVQLPAGAADALLMGPPNLFAAQGYAAPFQFADLLFSFELGAGLAGARVMFGRSGESTDAPGNTDESKGQNLILLAGGFSMKGDFRLDTALDLLIDTASEVAAGQDVQSGFGFGLGLHARGAMNTGEGVDLGFLGSFGFSSVSNTVEATDTTTSLTNIRLVLGAGPVYRLGDKAQIAAYGILGIDNTSTETATGDQSAEVSSNVITIPAMRLAGEFWLLEWFAVRAGLEYSYDLTLGTTADTDTTTIGGGFGWSTGVGFTKGDFAFDGTISHAWVTAGPDLVGGDGDLFTQVSASYRF